MRSTTIETNKNVNQQQQPTLVPFIVQRRGEEAAPADLVIHRAAPGRYRLHYLDEDPRDRDLHGVLWGRCSFNPVDEHGRPTGVPEWKMMHPFRQRITMQSLRCQVCTAPARTPLGFVFLSGPRDLDAQAETVLTNQPPVCTRHIQTAARLCPHLAVRPRVFLARSAPLYGVIGVIYGYDPERGVHVVAEPEMPLPYGHPNLPTCLGSQLVRRLSSFTVLTVDELIRELDTAGTP
ncbi:hypothetical protein [Streptomyces mangrovisoli]|uniref:Uncharacterized protein n=1 Tax=Streptomyces mangrovisoli TaxID=1428628 RepID=A0A1J4P0T2_9ACTN|nr:hypothetical protein [Streptomyces mangrovisoli]OIJ68337.1 hypothetical protein WN71_007905 [Streptomyces mangrovisoli]